MAWFAAVAFGSSHSRQTRAMSGDRVAAFPNGILGRARTARTTTCRIIPVHICKIEFGCNVSSEIERSSPVAACTSVAVLPDNTRLTVTLAIVHVALFRLAAKLAVASRAPSPRFKIPMIRSTPVTAKTFDVRPTFARPIGGVAGLCPVRVAVADLACRPCWISEVILPVIDHSNSQNTVRHVIQKRKFKPRFPRSVSY